MLDDAGAGDGLPFKLTPGMQGAAIEVAPAPVGS